MYRDFMSFGVPLVMAALLAACAGRAIAQEAVVPADADAAPAAAEQAADKAGDEKHDSEAHAKGDAQSEEAAGQEEHGKEEHGKEEHGKEEHGGEEHGGEEHGEGAHGGEEHGEGAHGGHHDPYDLSHQNASPSLTNPSELKADLAVWTFVVFLLLLGLLAKFAWGPIVAGLDRREAAIAARIEDAQQAADKAAAQLAQYEARLAAASDETREMMAQARKDAEALRERMVGEAQQAAQRERERAVEDITAAKNAALQDITERSVDLAVVMAGRLMERKLTADDRSSLIREALQQLPSKN